MSSDIISAPSTIANSTRLLNDKFNVLFEEVRPNYRNMTFLKAIKRQRVNILAISAFNVVSKSTSMPQRKLSCALSQSVLAPPKKFRRVANIVTNLLKHRTNRRRISQKEKCKSKGEDHVSPNISQAFSSMSQSNYEDFLTKKQREIEKELQSVKRSHSSRLAKRAMYRKHQIEKNRKELNKQLSKIESDNKKIHEKWAQKCVLSFPTN